MKSGIFDKNSIEVKSGDTLIFPYIDPMGRINEDTPNFEAVVIFKHGAFGYENKTDFVPLVDWSRKKTGEYISNHGNKTIILDIYPFWIKPPPIGAERSE